MSYQKALRFQITIRTPSSKNKTLKEKHTIQKDILSKVLLKAMLNLSKVDHLR